MKQSIICLIILFVAASLAATDVSGVQSGTWSLQNSPYNLVGEVTIPAGETLTIQPGVIVYAMGDYRINASGTIIAVGTPADSIRFESGQADPNALWTGIRLDNTVSPSEFAHCYIEKATYGINSVNSPVHIHHCRFNLNQKGMQLYGIGNPAVMDVHDNIVEYSIHNGILIPQNTLAHVHHNEIRYNGTGTQYYAAIQLSNQSGGGSNSPQINHNHILHNFKQGITGWDVVGANAIQPHIHHNLIEYNLTGIYLLNASGYVEENIIRHNFISGNADSGAGVMVAGATSQPYFERNQIYGNFTGFYLGTNANPILGDLSIYHAWAQGENQIYDNIDESNTLHSVFCYSYTNSSIVIKAENNFWGTNDPAEIDLGINDQLDSPSLPLVDYIPWLWDEEPVTLIQGVLSYPGALALTDAQIDIVSEASGQILHNQAVGLNQDFSMELDLEEPFYVIGKARIEGSEKWLYGCVDGFENVVAYQPESSLDLELTLHELGPQHCYTVGQFVIEDNLTLFPVTHSFWVYAPDYINWLYEEGDYRYLRRHTRLHDDGDIEVELSEGTIWEKFQNLEHGDSWARLEVMDDMGNLSLSSFSYLELESGESQPVTLLVQHDLDRDLPLCQHLKYPNQNWQVLVYNDQCDISYVYEYDNDSFATPHDVGDQLVLNQIPASAHPDHLCYNAGEYPSTGNLFLYWQGVAEETPHNWTDFKIYHNGNYMLSVPYFMTSTLLELDPQTSHQITIRAADQYDNLSDPSPVLYLQPVANDDHIQPPLAISLYPNPFSARIPLTINITGETKAGGEVGVYNLRGQLVKKQSFDASDAKSLTWDGRDAQGVACASGIYLVKVQLKGRQPVIKKVMKY